MKLKRLKSSFFFFFLFSVRLLSVLRCHSIFFIPATMANDLRLRRISLPDLIHYMYFLILILEKEPVFPFSMLSVKPGNCWYHCYNVFGMTRSLIRIEPGTSRTRSQHSTTRLSRRRCSMMK